MLRQRPLPRTLEASGEDPPFPPDASLSRPVRSSPIRMSTGASRPVVVPKATSRPPGWCSRMVFLATSRLAGGKHNGRDQVAGRGEGFHKVPTVATRTG
jgi:hypothetical protein